MEQCTQTSPFVRAGLDIFPLPTEGGKEGRGRGFSCRCDGSPFLFFLLSPWERRRKKKKTNKQGTEPFVGRDGGARAQHRPLGDEPPPPPPRRLLLSSPEAAFGTGRSTPSPPPGRGGPGLSGFRACARKPSASPCSLGARRRRPEKGYARARKLFGGGGPPKRFPTPLSPAQPSPARTAALDSGQNHETLAR